MRPHAESCDENRAPILAALRPRLPTRGRLLEIGSGTGQHAVYFAPEFPGLIWQPSDRTENHPGILEWLAHLPADNLRPPLALDVLSDDWPDERYDAAFSANTAHIMGEAAVAAMFAGVGRLLNVGGGFFLYGPFNEGGQYSSDSNRRFEGWLRQRDPQSGIRDLDWLREIAAAAFLRLDEDIEMPVNNRLLVWRRITG